LKRCSDPIVAEENCPRFRVRFTQPSDDAGSKSPLIVEVISSSLLSSSEVVRKEEVLELKNKYDKSELTFMKCFEPLPLASSNHESQVVDSNSSSSSSSSTSCDEIVEKLNKAQEQLKVIEERNRSVANVIYKRVVEENLLLRPSAKSDSNQTISATLKK
jgi:hypothetical protein